MIRLVGLFLIIGLIYTVNAEPCPVKDYVITSPTIQDAVDNGFISFEEGANLEKSINEGKQDIIPVDVDDGIIAFGVITYEDDIN
jgi:hypothetical protein